MNYLFACIGVIVLFIWLLDALGHSQPWDLNSEKKDE